MKKRKIINPSNESKIIIAVGAVALVCINSLFFCVLMFPSGKIGVYIGTIAAMVTFMVIYYNLQVNLTRQSRTLLKKSINIALVIKSLSQIFIFFEVVVFWISFYIVSSVSYFIDRSIAYEDVDIIPNALYAYATMMINLSIESLLVVPIVIIVYKSLYKIKH